MPKESNQSKSDSRAVRRLDPYNKSPREEENPERSSRHSSGEKTRSRPSQSGSRSETHSRSRSPSEPPQWARELLKNQEEYRKEIKRLQSEIERGRPSMSTRDERVLEPVFKYVGNKKQYELNNGVADKIQVALTTTDEQQRTAALNEGKSLLSERNKHILLAEKFGWDTVDCYTAEPLASDADDEKRIKKAVKECQRIRDEKKKKLGHSTKSKRQFMWSSGSQTERKGVVDRASFPAQRGVLAGKSEILRNNTSGVCFSLPQTRPFREGLSIRKHKNSHF